MFVTDRSGREPTVNRWVVRGSVYDSTSWHALELRKVTRKIRSYDWGTQVGFGIAGAGDIYLTSGWSTTSPTLHWSKGESAEMTLAVARPQKNISFQIKFLANIPPESTTPQTIRLLVGGKLYGEVVCDKKQWRVFEGVIPNNLVRDGRLVFSFEFPGAKKSVMGLYYFEANEVAN